MTFLLLLPPLSLSFAWSLSTPAYFLHLPKVFILHFTETFGGGLWYTLRLLRRVKATTEAFPKWAMPVFWRRLENSFWFISIVTTNPEGFRVISMRPFLFILTIYQKLWKQQFIVCMLLPDMRWIILPPSPPLEWQASCVPLYFSKYVLAFFKPGMVGVPGVQTIAPASGSACWASSVCIM